MNDETKKRVYLIDFHTLLQTWLFIRCKNIFLINIVLKRFFLKVTRSDENSAFLFL